MPLDPDAFADMVIQTIETALAPIMERLVKAEARLETVGDLRDRVVTVETKAAALLPPVSLDGLLERLASLESKTDRIALAETAVAELGKETVSLRERAAVLETRAPVPGPAGQDGAHGKDGADGLGFDDLAVVPAGERGVTVRATRGEQTKDIGTVTFAVDLYRGVWLDGKGYEQGDSVTWAGSEWHCNESTLTKPGDGSKAWTLKVKRGRDGKDGRDGRDLAPVVRVS